MNGETDQIVWKRRDALKLIALATAGVASGARESAAQSGAATNGPRGTLTDPKLINATADWPRELTTEEMATLRVLCDVIIPADAVSPAASEVKVHDFINEWVSAPYPRQQADQILIRGGLLWLDSESRRRFGTDFSHSTDAERASICEQIKLVSEAKRELKAAARFFALVRDLTATGFYTTDNTGWKDIGYVGNMLGFMYGQPPAEVLAKLPLDTPAAEQTAGTPNPVTPETPAQ